MKKLLIVLLALILCCNMACLAETGAADVQMEGQTYHLTLDSIDIVDGKLTIVLEGFGETLRMGANGMMIAGLPEAHYGDEIIHFTNVDINVGGAFTFTFDRNALPDEIWMTSYDENVEPVMIWQREATAAIPEALVGEWQGTGIPKNGGHSIDLKIVINADGSGEYTFEQGGYHESYPFTISNDDSTFSVDIPATSQLGHVDGTWVLEGDTLKLDITSTFTGGGSYSYTAECERVAESDVEHAGDYSHAEAGDQVVCGYAEGRVERFTPLLFTAEYENWDLVTATTDKPMPADGCVLLLRLTAQGWHSQADFVEVFAPRMRLRVIADGTELTPMEAVTGAPGRARSVDLLYYSPDYRQLDEFELLCDDVLYPLAGLPHDGIPLSGPTPSPEPTPTPEPTPVPTNTPLPPALAALNRMHRQAVDETGFDIDEAACTGNVVVAIYTKTGEGIGYDEVLTTDSDDNWNFPREYRAESADTARWAAIIYPTKYQVGWYTGIAGGAANRTTTWLSLFDLETEKHYKVKVAVEEPPQTITVQTINGIPMSSGASGKFRSEDAVAKLTELVETARQQPTPEPTPTPTATPTPEPTPTPTPTPEPTLEPTSESTDDLPDVKSLLDAGAQDAVNKLRMGSIGLNERVGEGINAAENATPTENDISDIDMTDVILDALKEEVYRTTYDALLSGEVIQKGSKGDTAKGVQQMLVDFGQSISVDGNVGSKTIAALNVVQSAFGLKQTNSLDAEGYAALLPRLLIATDLDAADELLLGRMDAGEYDYMRACAMFAQEKYASAKALFEESGWGEWEERVEACVQPWPKTGVLYKNPSVKGSSTELTVKFNTDPDTAMLVKIYTTDGVLARTMFIGGTGKATTSLPAGTYIIKDGTGHNWYGEEEAFGKKEGSYEIMTFDNGEQLVELKRNYRSTITINVQENDPNAAGVGSDYENWEDF